MSDKPAACVRIEDELLASAIGEAPSATVARVERHITACGSCRREFENYRAVDTAVIAMREEPLDDEPAARAREHLETRLADLRSRLLVYGIFPSPLGNLLIARSELGISLIEYLDRGTSVRSSRMIHTPGVELVEGGGELKSVHRELLDYLQGRRTQLAWSLDMRLVKSEFHRAVLQATAGVPYGAVVPYAGLARDIGKANAVRAVAQALRWNPLPIVIPCHRVIGMSGALTGYAGSKVDLKQKLLSIEGIPITKRSGVLEIAPRTMYVLYPGDQEYCVPSCPSLDTRKPQPLTRFASREHAENAGFAPCTTCRPDLHPISR